MAIQKVLQLGDPSLKAPNSAICNVNDSIVQHVITDLVDTMRSSELVGIAGPQIGKNVHIIVSEIRPTKTRTADQADSVRVYINPAIFWKSKETTVIYEGCGSVASGNIFGPVRRPTTIIIEATDQKGIRFQLKCNGLLSRVIQHEYDHLSGIEFTEKIEDYKALVSYDWYVSHIKNNPEYKKLSLVTIKEYRPL